MVTQFRDHTIPNYPWSNHAYRNNTSEILPYGDNRAEQVRGMVDTVYRSDSRRVFATLIRLLGDFDLAEEALLDAFTAAVEQWPRSGVPANPRAWLVSAGRFKAIDTIRRRARFDAILTRLAEQQQYITPHTDPTEDPEDIEDDRLRLIFTCCHPSLPPEARIALILREVCDLTTEEVAHTFLAAPSTVAQRIVRAKAKIRESKIPYEVPTQSDLPDRLDTVLHVIYLIFNEGYSASSGDTVTRTDLSNEAIRLARLLYELLPEPEVMGLLALMLLHESRRAARTTPEGDLILLEDQDRSLWNRTLIEEGESLVERALRSRRFGKYSLQAAISAVHADSPTASATDWPQIVGLYNLLAHIEPSPIIDLNRAVAIAMRDGALAGLTLIDALLEQGHLQNYHLVHAARAELCRRSGKTAEAITAFQQALALAKQEPEQRFLSRRLEELNA